MVTLVWFIITPFFKYIKHVYPVDRRVSLTQVQDVVDGAPGPFKPHLVVRDVTQAEAGVVGETIATARA